MKLPPAMLQSVPMLGSSLVIEPPIVNGEGAAYCDSARTYSQYNYFGGLSARIKRRHFQVALELTREHFQRANVIDFGCADGFFLPSLASRFCRVVGVDQSPEFVAIADQVIARAGLRDTHVLCNRDVTMAELRNRMPAGPFHLAFLLEVLEHVGSSPATMYSEKLELLRELSDRFLQGGLIVASVPRMVGASFLLQRVGLAALRLQREPLSMSELLRASLLKNTDALEPTWNSFKHLGFNHEKLERAIAGHFRVLKRRHEFFQVVYLLAPR